MGTPSVESRGSLCTGSVTVVGPSMLTLIQAESEDHTPNLQSRDSDLRNGCGCDTQEAAENHQGEQEKNTQVGSHFFLLDSAKKKVEFEE